MKAVYWGHKKDAKRNKIYLVKKIESFSNRSRLLSKFFPMLCYKDRLNDHKKNTDVCQKMIQQKHLKVG